MNWIGRADLLALGLSIGAFILFLVVHVALLRTSETFPADRAITWSAGLGALGIGGVAVAGGANFLPLHLSAASALVSLLASGGIYILLVFHYLVWMFGMGEAAIRIRLLRELEQAPEQASSIEEILSRYNARKIFEARLERLLKAGHLEFDGSTYGLKRKILLLQIGVEKTLKQLLGISYQPSCRREPV